MPINSTPLRIELFDPDRHDRSEFRCGVDRLDNFLRLSAKKQQRADMSRVYVVVADGSSIILGYHAINLGSIDLSALPKKPRGAPAHGELPALFISQVAVDLTSQGQGIGDILMHHIFQKAVTVANQAGCYALVLDVMADGGEAMFHVRAQWYRRFGFIPFSIRPSRMFMTMQQVRNLVK